jgi:lipoate-protein ligase A
MHTWRFIETESCPGYVNMAIDEALLDIYLQNNSGPVLRFYRWSKPTLSLGRNQKISEINLEGCKAQGIDIVARPTGGKAVLHQSEFTYSFIAGKKDEMPENIFASYLIISRALICGLEKLKAGMSLTIGEEQGADYFRNSFCFSSSTVSDLNYYGSKLVGSAQLRRGDALLQHGSVLIDQDFTILDKIFAKQDNNAGLINLKDILGFVPSYENIKNCILEGFRDFFKIEFKSDSLSFNEKNLAESYYSKYDLRSKKGLN